MIGIAVVRKVPSAANASACARYCEEILMGKRRVRARRMSWRLANESRTLRRAMMAGKQFVPRAWMAASEGWLLRGQVSAVLGP